MGTKKKLYIKMITYQWIIPRYINYTVGYHKFITHVNGPVLSSTKRYTYSVNCKRNNITRILI